MNIDMNQKLFFNEFYSDKPTTVLFLHGGGGAGWMWQPVIERMSGYHCLAVDLPEHGGSKHVGPFSMELAAQKAAELVREKAHGGKAVVVGLSEGAQVAVQMLSTSPEVCSRAFISSALLLPMPGAKMFSSRKLIGSLFRMSVPPFRNNDWWIRLNMKYAAGIPEAYFALFKQDFRNMTESQFVNLMTANQTYRLPDGLEKVKVPVLAACGKHEYKAMQESVRLLAEKLPNSKAYLINLGEHSSLSAEHNWALTVPEEFAESLRSLLENKPLPKVLMPQ